MRMKRFGEFARRLGKAGTCVQTRSWMEPTRVKRDVSIWKELKARMYKLAYADVYGDGNFVMDPEKAKHHLIAQTHLMVHYVEANKSDLDVMKEIVLPAEEILRKQPKPPVPSSLFKGLPKFDSRVAVIGPGPEKKVTVYDQLDVKQMVGVSMPMAYIPIGTLIHGIEINPGQGGKLTRAKGCFAKIIKKQEDRPRVTVRLPSGVERVFDSRCRAVVGPLTNPNYVKPKLYKAGQNRWKGIRPHVRGVAKNPVDHPHGGRTNGGRPSVTPWGKPCKCGYKTVRKKKRQLT